MLPFVYVYSFFIKANWRLVSRASNGLLIHTKSDYFHQRINLLQRFGYAPSCLFINNSPIEVLVLVPIHKKGNPSAGLFFAAEWPVGIVKPVLNGVR